jgi:hypothetical protein
LYFPKILSCLRKNNDCHEFIGSRESVCRNKNGLIDDIIRVAAIKKTKLHRLELCHIVKGDEKIKKERGPEPRPLLQATILFHLRGRL